MSANIECVNYNKGTAKISGIKKILVANRGEIACRIFKTAKLLNINTVAIYSEADADGLHVELADEAFCVGPAPPTESYMNITEILAVAKKTKADAVHPGYGFLSENADFANKIQAAGLTWIGPPTESIVAMGSKSEAKRLMEHAKVPLLQGYHGKKQEPSWLLEQAQSMGFPIMLKASAGGGGKGMRVVNSEKDFFELLTSAKREALKSFADDTILIEKFLPSPRHIEVQIFFDEFGQGVYLFDRDCSVQRRHQKVVEEAPAPNLHDDIKHAMGDAAIAAGHAINYVGAGTVEFLLDTDGSFYFMEMNTRLQVEHPVTEMVTHQDLVEWQILIADKQKLPVTQDQLKIHGHSLEVRLYAENVKQDFMPSSGTISYLKFPDQSETLRIETGVRSGDTVPPYYDPMIAKLVTFGETRTSAISNMIEALEKTLICGLSTNRDFLIKVLENKSFQSEDFSTGLIDNNKDDLLLEDDNQIDYMLTAAALWTLHHQNDTFNRDSCDIWSCNDGWRMNQASESIVVLSRNKNEYIIKTSLLANGFSVDINNKIIKVNAVSITGEDVIFAILNQHYKIIKHLTDITIISNKLTLAMELPNYSYKDESASGFSAPMNGTIVKVMVKLGEKVKKDSPVIILEAMKMEHTVRAHKAGIIKSIYFGKGDLVEEGASLVALEGEE